ncbi:hypothetical protein QVD17_06832 [Tagetes erecta]|uniref:Uncharacterized protein n=1 Tax=Tagetes erecta TaxID=13708 RepID=A0AAD8LLF0_TARER|nr:hypothetical protein QVD17_06832 [Tagetes erecta]
MLVSKSKFQDLFMCLSTWSFCSMVVENGGGGGWRTGMDNGVGRRMRMDSGGGGGGQIRYGLQPSIRVHGGDWRQWQPLIWPYSSTMGVMMSLKKEEVKHGDVTEGKKFNGDNSDAKRARWMVV